ncbi:MAG: hypothetical protein LUH21_17430 [Clostridiales bacterium]|nr:hypothetical protein [Clostridiales bacterium]
MQGTTQNYTLDMADGTAPKPLIVKQGDTNSREARISLTAFKEPWTIPFGAQIHINVRKNDKTYANATCTQEDEHTVLAPITEQMTTVPGTQLGELFFLGTDGDIRSQTFPLVVWDAVTDLDLMQSSNDFQALKAALRDVKISTETADIATQYATEQGNAAGMAAQRAEDAADSIQVAVDAAANAKACESNAKDSEIAAAQTQQEVTDYVESQKAAFVGYSKRESDSKYANAITATAEGEGGVTVEDSWTAPVLDMEVAGRSEQVTTTGAQLLDFKKCLDDWGATYAQNGNAFTVSAIGYAYDTPFSFSNTDIQVTLSGSIQDISGSEFTVDLLNSEGVAITRITKDKQSVTATASKIRLNYSVRGIGKYSAIMLNAGDTPLPYEPYTGGAPSPSPDYPQDIISTGTVSTGAQLFDAGKVLNKSLGGAAIVNNADGSITISGSGTMTDTLDTRCTLTHDETMALIGNKRTFTVTANITTCPYFFFNFIDKTGAVLRAELVNDATSITRTIPTTLDIDTLYIQFGYYGRVDTSIVSGTQKVMVNAGSTPEPWEPYTGGKPSPSEEYPQTLKVVVRNQLLEWNKLSFYNCSQVENGAVKCNIVNRSYASISADYLGKYILSLKGKIITASCKGNPPGKVISILVFGTFGDGSEYKAASAEGDTVTFAVPDNVLTVSKLEIRLNNSSTSFTDTTTIISDIMLSTEESCRTAPITLTEPLRGIGDYRDRIRCRDGVWGVERQCLRDNITSVDATQNSYFVKNVEAYRFKPCDWSVAANAICNQLTVVPYNNRKDNCIALRSTANQDGWAYCLCIESIDQTIAAYNAWLSEHVVSVVAILSTPTWEPLPDATQQALNALTTYAGTTHLTITAGGAIPSVTLDYVKDTHKALEQCQEAAKEYTDNQIAAIVAALPTATQAAIVDNQTTRLLQEV